MVYHDTIFWICFSLFDCEELKLHNVHIVQCKQCEQCRQCKQFMWRCYLHLWWYFCLLFICTSLQAPLKLKSIHLLLLLFFKKIRSNQNVKQLSFFSVWFIAQIMSFKLTLGFCSKPWRFSHLSMPQYFTIFGTATISPLCIKSQF